MMKESRRALRMIRHHSRKKAASLNMVSLMDIFTILVFFLLVSASDQESLPSMKDIKLPEAYADQKPKENIVILVSGKNIVVAGEIVADARLAVRARNSIIPGLAQKLQAEAVRRTSRRANEKKIKKRGITIMGDKKIPYVLLKKIMLTSASADFTNISLAIAKKPPAMEEEN
ncbi:hypothetical protein MNBD_GAMMA21-2970 [hydrothermal vent metagenome]|uniref:Adventurous gliding motility protein S n=1 Tax=hydrothermal vent metagenome TaxID=652676 RepID=A0A3B0ZS88_9ZZZZ